MNTQQLLSVIQQLPYFTKQNLALALGKENENLNYWIKKLIREKLLIPLKKGFYISQLYQQTALKTPVEQETYWIYIANTLCAPSYVSLEYVLSRYSIIPESVFHPTSVTTKSTRQFRSPQTLFIYRHIPHNLFNGYETIPFGYTGLHARIAKPYKALCDFIYLKPFSSKTVLRNYLLEEGRINWDALDEQQKKQLTNYVKSIESVKLNTMVAILKKEGIV